ncbi:MAG: hypothetical protein M3Q65_10530 [Chloroflexota bacterium]|nr:hypothetical protein [Chloroflexota bacterium]
MVAKLVAQTALLLLVPFLAACDGGAVPGTAPITGGSPALSAATGTATPPATVAATPIPELVVTTTPSPTSISAAPRSDTQTPPPGCNLDEVTRLVERFLDAFNRGDSAQLARFFGPRFEWYSVTDRGRESGDRHFLAYNPNGGLRLGAFPEDLKVTVGHQDILLRYFAERHTHHERLWMRELGGTYDARGPAFHIGYTLGRTADDLEPRNGNSERETLGKGAVDYTDQTIMVWSIGTP